MRDPDGFNSLRRRLVLKGKNQAECASKVMSLARFGSCCLAESIRRDVAEEKDETTNHMPLFNKFMYSSSSASLQIACSSMSLSPVFPSAGMAAWYVFWGIC
jgi:hypothetical protein